GMLTYGVVPSRLPQAVVDWDVAQVKGLGVKFQFKTEATKEELEKFDAVFVGTGLWEAKLPKLEGAELKGVWTAIDYLKAAKTKAKGFDAGKRVIVVGGGDVAVDCAVTAKLLGAEDVRVLYRRTIDEAPASISEFHYLLDLGIGITTGLYPVAAKGTKTKMNTVEVEGFYDKKAKASFTADTLVFATGQSAEDQEALAPVPVTEKGLIKVKKGGQASGKYFAAGDIVNGGKTAVEAVAAGKEAAASIIAYLEKKGVK
ncbi:MAG: FAD-dependent oxidoreductase, partial [Firmicutes bacterium]|nr:FAD-dependent oxidoreductase [Bacillota bacterium]